MTTMLFEVPTLEVIRNYSAEAVLVEMEHPAEARTEAKDGKEAAPSLCAGCMSSRQKGAISSSTSTPPTQLCKG